MAKDTTSATRLAIGGWRDSWPRWAEGRAAPNTHADSGGPAPQSRAAVPGMAPRPVPILVGARPRGHSKSAGSPPLGEGPVWLGSRAGRVVGRLLLCRGGPAGAGGTWDGTLVPSPHYLRQLRADLAVSPAHRRAVFRPLTTTVTIKRARPASDQTGRLPGLRPRTPAADWWSRDSGVSSCGLAPKAPVRLRLAGRPVAQ